MLLTVLFSTQSFAARCIIIGAVKENSSCHRVSTRLDVSDQEACEAFAKSTKENRFFHILEKNETLISTSYKFKDFSNRIKIKKTIKHLSEDCELK